jgi:hypothetical protein
MNHNTTLSVAATAAAMAVTGITAMATPALAWGHHHHNNGIKVNQSIDQANVCYGLQPVRPDLAAVQQQSTTLCVNNVSNNADIQR